MTRATASTFSKFKQTIWAYHRAHRRDMPWREGITPYRVVISEMMLQQTQVSRVMKIFDPWMKRFPDWQSLAEASVKDILQEWSGLGYNRRALYLKRTTDMIATGATDKGTVFFNSNFKRYLTSSSLKLPGIGPNTAGSIRAFAWNEPVAFIETNIRSVFIHFFFASRRSKVRDDEIIPLVEQALADKKIRAHAREWYYALMDYGSYLKGSKSSGSPAASNPSRKSAHHVRQKPFKGSNRELRSKILKLIMEKPRTQDDLDRGLSGYPAAQIKKNISDLVREGFMARRASRYRIA